MVVEGTTCSVLLPQLGGGGLTGSMLCLPVQYETDWHTYQQSTYPHPAPSIDYWWLTTVSWHHRRTLLHILDTPHIQLDCPLLRVFMALPLITAPAAERRAL